MNCTEEDLIVCLPVKENLVTVMTYSRDVFMHRKENKGVHNNKIITMYTAFHSKGLNKALAFLLLSVRAG